MYDSQRVSHTQSQFPNRKNQRLSWFELPQNLHSSGEGHLLLWCMAFHKFLDVCHQQQLFSWLLEHQTGWILVSKHASRRSSTPGQRDFSRRQVLGFSTNLEREFWSHKKVEQHCQLPSTECKLSRKITTNQIVFYGIWLKSWIFICKVVTALYLSLASVPNSFTCRPVPSPAYIDYNDCYNFTTIDFDPNLMFTDGTQMTSQCGNATHTYGMTGLGFSAFQFLFATCCRFHF